jgi:hypothetical protein
MDISRPRKSDTVLVFIGLVIFVLLVLGVFFVVRKQPEIPKQAPGAPGAAAYRRADRYSNLAAPLQAAERLSNSGRHQPE